MQRNSILDTVKFLMIFLVVFGHFIEPIIGNSAAIKTLYLSVYSFHMPVFVILAGAFTQSGVSEKSTRKYITTLLVPFIAFTILYEIFTVIETKSISDYSLNWEPYWTLWFLFSLFIWRVSLPIVMRFKFPVLISFAVAIAAGYVNDVNYFLGISRTLYFFPFFLLGYTLGPSLLSNEYLRKVPRAGYFSVLMFNVLVFWVLNDLSPQWLYGSVPYAQIGANDINPFAMRIFIYFVSLSTSIAILMLIPEWMTTFSSRGRASLYVYVWHGFFVKIAMYFSLMQIFSAVSNTFAVISLLIIAAAVTFLLSSDFLVKQTNRLILRPAQKLLLLKS